MKKNIVFIMLFWIFSIGTSWGRQSTTVTTTTTGCLKYYFQNVALIVGQTGCEMHAFTFSLFPTPANRSSINFNCFVNGNQVISNFNYNNLPTNPIPINNVNGYGVPAKIKFSVTIDSCSYDTTFDYILCPLNYSCTDCIGSFAPIPGKKYLLSAWVNDTISSPTTINYTDPQIYLEFPGTSIVLGPFATTGAIIDGWQRIEAEFTIPNSATYIKIKLESQNHTCLFDDIRIIPFDGSMKSYVYDPVNMRLMAELDERNYATKYEYDEEGKLVRIKKETERGVMTIQESKNSSPKR